MSYRSIAAKLGMELCESCDLNVHTGGWADIPRGKIHWQERRMTRSGLRRFLMEAAEIALYRDGYRGGGLGERIWLQNTWAYRTAMSLGVRLPRRLSELDRARVLALPGPASGAAKRWARGG